MTSMTNSETHPGKSFDHSAEETKLRQELAAVYRMLDRFHLTELTFTHASVRLPGPERNFLLNPYGLLFDEINASSLIKVDLNGHVLEDNGYELNPSAFPVHSAIHSGREDALAVLHLHTVAGSAIAAQKDGLLMLNQISMAFFNRLGYHDYKSITYDVGERDSFVKDLGKNDALILRNHGLVTVGSTPGQAFVRMYYLYMACEIQIAALAGNRPLLLPEPDVAEHVAEQWAGTNTGDKVVENGSIGRAWAALIRKLDRTNPDYKD